MKKNAFLLFIAFLIAISATAQTNSIKLHIKTFNDFDGNFSEKEDDGSGTITYFNEFFNELYIFVEIDPQNLGKYIKPNEYQPFTLKVTTTKGKVVFKEFKKPIGFSYNGIGLNKCFVLFQLNNISDATYKIKIDLMKANTIISSAKKTVDIYGGE